MTFDPEQRIEPRTAPDEAVIALGGLGSKAKASKPEIPAVHAERRAQSERAKLRKQRIERMQELRQNRWNKLVSGAEIDGSSKLSNTIGVITRIEQLEPPRRVVSPNGWSYLRSGVFWREDTNGAVTEFIIGREYEDRRRVTCRETSGTGRQLSAECLNFLIDENGVVSDQDHLSGPATRLGEYDLLVGDTTALYSRMTSPDARITAEDISRLQTTANQIVGDLLLLATTA